MQVERWLVLGVICAAGGCSEDDPGSTEPPPPNEPLALPNPAEGRILFAVTDVDGAAATQPAFVLNGGAQALVFEAPSLSGAAVFTLGEARPAGRSVDHGDGFRVPVIFDPDTSGVFLGELVLSNNSTNLPQLTFELIGPARSVADAARPRLALFEDDLTVTAPAANTSVSVFVRYYNLGGEHLSVTGYQLSGDPAFDANAIVAPSASEPVVVTPSSFVVVELAYAPAAAGSHAATFTITSDDPELPVAEVALQGSTP